MNPPKLPQLHPELRAFFQRELQLPAEAGPEQLLAAWLRELGEQEGMPARHRQRMFEQLLEADQLPRNGLPAILSEAYDENLLREVEAFAAEMFSLRVTERKRRWQEFVNRSQYAPQAHARLVALRGPLTLEWNEIPADSPDAIELAERLARLCTLTGGARGAGAPTAARKVDREAEAVSDAANLVQRYAPRLCESEALLLGDVCRQRMPPTPDAASQIPDPYSTVAYVQMPPIPDFPPLIQENWSRDRVTPPAVTTFQIKKQPLRDKWWLFLILVLGTSLFRLAVSDRNKSNPFHQPSRTRSWDLEDDSDIKTKKALSDLLNKYDPKTGKKTPSLLNDGSDQSPIGPAESP